MKGVYWLKKDFRLLDNPVLTKVLKNCKEVLVIYILEPEMIAAGETSAFHLKAINTAFNEFQKNISEKGGQATWVEGNAIDVLSKVFEFGGYNQLYSHIEIGVDRTYKRDLAVKELVKKYGVEWIEENQTGVFRKLTDRDKRAKIWQKFYTQTPHKIPTNRSLKKVIVPEVLQDYLRADSLEMPVLNRLKLDKESNLQLCTESAALDTLDSFLNIRGEKYSGGISSPNTALIHGSRLSIHLAWGTISPRVAYQKTLEKKEEYKSIGTTESKKWVRSLTAFTARLHWRDHFIQRLESEPQMEFAPLNSAYEEVNYDATKEMINAWTYGTTGFPMVDACIRCLRQTGFVNFRMRAMLTSFGCHVLHIDWRTLDHLMARMYTDYEPGIHLSQLQMQAGVVGINTIRIYNPHKQLLDQDPDCVFVKEWIPELKQYDCETIQEHRLEPLGDYPGQIVDYVTHSKTMRSQLWSIKMRKTTKAIANDVYQKHGSRKSPKKRKTVKKSKDNIKQSS